MVEAFTVGGKSPGRKLHTYVQRGMDLHRREFLFPHATIAALHLPLGTILHARLYTGLISHTLWELAYIEPSLCFANRLRIILDAGTVAFFEIPLKGFQSTRAPSSCRLSTFVDLCELRTWRCARYRLRARASRHLAAFTSIMKFAMPTRCAYGYGHVQQHYHPLMDQIEAVLAALDAAPGHTIYRLCLGTIENIGRFSVVLVVHSVWGWDRMALERARNRLPTSPRRYHL